ncbi:MAG: hypothetical protein OEQ39_04165 [Gammaproteobacteria bacterium]|nr:hypothetical protein [Gammaproteobacteria bacterium]MDH3466193.1 hypothetical protein [Gammaproteobacteria bacterium]
MSREADKIKHNLHRYVRAMRDQGKEPTALYVTKHQFGTLRAEAKESSDSFRPRFMGIEIKVELK